MKELGIDNSVSERASGARFDPELLRGEHHTLPDYVIAPGFQLTALTNQTALAESSAEVRSLPI